MYRTIANSMLSKCLLSKVFQTARIGVGKDQTNTSCVFIKQSTNNNINFEGIMRSTNVQRPIQRYRVIDSNRKVQIIGKIGLKASQKQANKRFIQTKLVGRAQRNLSSEHEEYEVEDEDDLSPASDMDYISEAELQHTDNEKRAFSALTSTVRPLLQLFSEDDSCSPNKAASSVHRTKTQDTSHGTQQTVYNNICLTSEDEEYEEETDTILDMVRQEEVIRPRIDSLSRFEWSPKSTNIFLDLWEKNLKDLRGTRKNAHIHKEMAEEMCEYGPSPREIKSKMDNMSRKYRVELKKIKNGNQTNWRYYKRVESLLCGTPSVDFEEIIFDNTESSSFFNADSSEEENEIVKMSHKDKEPEQQQPTPVEEPEQVAGTEVEEQQPQVDEHKKHHPPMSQRSHGEEYSTPSSGRRTNKMLQIEEQKLSIEKQKLQVMKHISRELASISKTLIELLRNKK